MSRQTRRKFLKQASGVAGLAATSSLIGTKLLAQTSGQRPNILFISVDDLNDFVGAFGGYHGVLTPNMDRLAREGVAFQRAYCAGPYCGASRSSLMTGAAPHRSGIVGNYHILSDDMKPAAMQRLGQSSILTLPAHFKAAGYKTLGGGKLYHAGFGQGANNVTRDESSWDMWFNTSFNEIAHAYPGVRNFRDNRTAAQLNAGEGAPGDLPSMIGADYNTLDQENMTPDKLLAKWGTEQFMMGTVNASQPFFMGLGFYRPHIGMYVPQRFYDMYPLDSIRVPDFRGQLDDLRDLPEYALRYLINMDWTAYGKRMPDGSLSSDHYLLQAMLAKQNRSGHAQAIQAYLASITYVDECIGQVLAALDRSGLRQNTIVVLWSDHGWFLGEKLSWQKFKMWERASRVPLVISTPNGPRGNCFSPVSLLDVFPTLAELAHAPIPDAYKRQIDGRSLSSHLANPGAEYSTYAVTTQSIARTGDTGPGQPGPGTDIFHSIRTNRWRYTKYPDFPGAALSEELYDLRNDPGETRNLLFWEPDRHADVRATLAELLRRRTS